MFDFRYEKVGKDKDIVAVVLTGRLDETNCTYVLNCVEEEIRDGRKKLILDCGPLEYISSMAHREIDRVEIDELEGRVTGVLLTPYPPGIPLLIPGERFNRTIVEYLKFARSFNQKFPGFDTDIHGLVEETVDGTQRYYMVAVLPKLRVGDPIRHGGQFDGSSAEYCSRDQGCRGR